MADRVINLLITTHHLDRGGVEEVILTYARLLDKHRYRITVACLNAGTVASEISEIPGVNLIHITTRNRFKRLVSFWKIARSSHADVVHNHACWYGIVAGWLTGARRVETVHNMYHWFKWHERFFYGVYCRLADRVISVSEYVRTFTIDFFPLVNPAKIVVVHNGIDLNKVQTDSSPSKLREQYSIREEEVVAGFVGRLTDQKGVEYLLRAAKLLSSTSDKLRFVIVGDGDLRPELESIATELQLANVIFTGFQRDVYPYLQMFDIFVLPSLWEGLPVSVLEAMACSKPVIATRVSGTPEVVQDGVTGFLVEPKDVEGLKTNLEVLIQKPELRRQMGKAGRERIENLFSAEATITKTEQIYHQLLNQA